MMIVLSKVVVRESKSGFPTSTLPESSFNADSLLPKALEYANESKEI